MNKVYTFWAKAAPLAETECYGKIYNLMPDFRKEKADRIRSMEDKAMSIGAWYLSMKAREYLGITGEEPFNLSHSGGYVLVSIGPEGEQVGCDLETVKGCKNNLAKRYFCPGEYAYIMSRPKEEQAQAFYRCWVLKESFMKATKHGMGMGFDTFELELGEEGVVLIRQPHKIQERYYFKESQIQGGKACIAVCSTYEEFEEPIQLHLV